MPEATPNAAEPTLADAIDAGLADAMPKPVADPVVPDPVVEDQDPPETDAETPPDGETPEQKVEREAAAALAAEALKNETPEQKAARETAEAAAKKPADHINDPIPPTVSQRTRERITGLVAEVKARDQTIAENTQLFQQIADTGVTPDNFAQTLTTLRLFNSDKIEDKRQALTFLQAQVTHLAKLCGEAVPGTDPLEGHDDLQKHVNAGTITQEHAAELAVARNRVKARDAATTGAQQAQETATTELTTARENARVALNAVGAALKDLDTDYAAKVPAVLAKLKPVFATTHPSKWVDLFKAEYKAFKVPAGTAAAPVVPAKPTGQPLRPNKQPAGGGQAQPKSMHEAIEAGLASMK